MDYWQLTIPVILSKEVTFKDMHKEISDVINKAMLMDESLKNFHELNAFKLYVFSGFYPVNKAGYKKGEMYSFLFRCLDRTFALKMKNLIKVVQNDLFKVVAIEIESKEQSPISELYTVTPTIAVFTEENKKPRHWTNSDFDIGKLKDRMNSNAQKKYSLWMDKEIDRQHSFIEDIVQVNEKVIVLNYKNSGKLLTNKFKIKVKQDKLSQEIAFMILATGLLEKNSLGLGFCTSAK